MHTYVPLLIMRRLVLALLITKPLHVGINAGRQHMAGVRGMARVQGATVGSVATSLRGDAAETNKMVRGREEDEGHGWTNGHIGKNGRMEVHAQAYIHCIHMA